MSNFFDKLKDFVGISEEYIEEDVQEEVPVEKNAYTVGRDKSSSFESSLPISGRTREAFTKNTEAKIGSTNTNMTSTAKNNVIGLPGISSNATSEVVVIEPLNFGEMPQVIKTLRERKSVVLNLNVMDPDEAQRSLDFVAGGTYAIDGHQERVGEKIFLFTPTNVKVSNVSGKLTTDSNKPAAPNSTNNEWDTEATRIAL